MQIEDPFSLLRMTYMHNTTSKYIPPTVSPSIPFPEGDASHEELTALAAELNMQVIMEPEHGLVLPDLTDDAKIEQLISKIAGNLMEARAAIDAAKAAGKHVVYIPGSYDLVHKGHAFYVQQVINAYVNASGTSREDLFLVMLADDDKLIAEVKASKLISNGGDEPSPRPVEPAHERVLAMAALDVDLVGILPSPKADTKFHPVVPALDLDRMQAELEAEFDAEQAKRIAMMGLADEKLAKAQKQASVDLADLRNAIPGYRTMLERSAAGLPLCPDDVVLNAEDDAETMLQMAREQFPGYSVKLKTSDSGERIITFNIPVQPWQLYTTSILNGADAANMGQPQRYTAGETTRLVSKDDSKYLAQVIYLMHYANVAVVIIDDVNIGSTSSLLKAMVDEHGENAWGETRALKADAMDVHVALGNREALLQTAARIQAKMEGHSEG